MGNGQTIMPTSFSKLAGGSHIAGCSIKTKIRFDLSRYECDTGHPIPPNKIIQSSSGPGSSEKVISPTMPFEKMFVLKTENTELRLLFRGYAGRLS